MLKVWEVYLLIPKGKEMTIIISKSAKYSIDPADATHCNECNFKFGNRCMMFWKTLINDNNDKRLRRCKPCIFAEVREVNHGKASEYKQ